MVAHTLVLGLALVHVLVVVQDVAVVVQMLAPDALAAALVVALTAVLLVVQLHLINPIE